MPFQPTICLLPACETVLFRRTELDHLTQRYPRLRETRIVPDLLLQRRVQRHPCVVAVCDVGRRRARQARVDPGTMERGSQASQDGNLAFDDALINSSLCTCTQPAMSAIIAPSCASSASPQTDVRHLQPYHQCCCYELLRIYAGLLSNGTGISQLSKSQLSQTFADTVAWST